MKPSIKKLFNYLIQGLIVIAPIFITGYALWALFQFIDNLIPTSIPGLGFLIIIIMALIVGYYSSQVLKNKLYNTIDKQLRKIPFIKTIYTSIKDFVSAVGKTKKFNHPVLVDVHGSGSYQLGFLTNESIEELGIKEFVCVYLPFPFSIMGELFFVKKDRIKPVKQSSTDVLKFIISGGVSTLQNDMIQEKINLSAGPSYLPTSIMNQAIEGLKNFNNNGVSIAEISHRSNLYIDLQEEVRTHIKTLMNLNNDFEVLFLQGGGSTQFAQVPINFLGKNEIAAYTDTGLWATLAIAEAKQIGNISVVASSKDKQYCYIPKKFDIPTHAKYLHITTNNTVVGSQWHTQDIPFDKVPIIADMSSDIFARPFDYSKCAMIYAATQKNIGIAGATVVVINKLFLQQAQQNTNPIPIIFDYKKLLEAPDKMYNTPSTVSIYFLKCILDWMDNITLPNIYTLNNQKANLIYHTLEKYPDIFILPIAKEDRSMMNITALFHNSKVEADFIQYAEKQGLVFLKGHAFAGGGIRLSMYNTFPLEKAQKVVEIIDAFATNQKY